MRLKAKLIKKPNIINLIKIYQIFNIDDNINIDNYKNIIEFYEDNQLIGFINFIEIVYLEYTKTFIKSINVIDKKYLDYVIKKMIIIMRKNKYTYTHLDSENKSYDKNTIEILKLNNFVGDDFLFLNL